MEHQEKIKYLTKLKELSDVLNDMIEKNNNKHNYRIEFAGYCHVTTMVTHDSYVRLILAAASAKDNIRHDNFYEAYDILNETLEYYPDIRNDVRCLKILKNAIEEAKHVWQEKEIK